MFFILFLNKYGWFIQDTTLVLVVLIPQKHLSLNLNSIAMRKGNFKLMSMQEYIKTLKKKTKKQLPSGQN